MRRLYNEVTRTLESLLPLGFVIVMAAFTIAAISLNRSAHQGEEAHTALCSFRADIENRRDGLVSYIHNHPDGIPEIGVTRTTLITQLTQYRRTLRALQSTNC